MQIFKMKFYIKQQLLFFTTGATIVLSGFSYSDVYRYKNIFHLAKSVKPIIILSGGVSTAIGEQSQSFTFADTLFNYNSNVSGLKPLIGGFVGIEYSSDPFWAWQFGVGFYQAVSSSINGTEVQAPISSLEATNDWNYQYKILNRQILIETKLSYLVKNRYHPYLIIGLGEGLNNAYAYQVTPQNSGEIATAIFKSRLNRNFIYATGLGLDIDVLSQVRIGAGYRIVYVGKYDLGQGTLDTGAGGSVFQLPGLKSNRSYTQEGLVQFTYLF